MVGQSTIEVKGEEEDAILIGDLAMFGLAVVFMAGLILVMSVVRWSA